MSKSTKTTLMYVGLAVVAYYAYTRYAANKTA